MQDLPADIKQTLTTKFNLNPQEWDIVDGNADIALMHYRVNRGKNYQQDSPAHPDVRGWVVDVHNLKLVAKSFPYTPAITLDQIDSDTIVDDNGQVYRFDKPMYKEGFEGTTIRVFRHAGKTYYSSHRRLDTSKSRWGSSIPFRQMYDELGGPHDLFDESKAYSPHCYVFLVVHPDVAHVSQKDIGNGWVQFLHRVTSYSKDNCPYPIDQVDWTVKELEPQKTISRQEANQVLKDGGFVIVSKSDGFAVKINSSDYSFRSNVRNNDPNLLHRFNELVDEVDLLEGINTKGVRTDGVPGRRAEQVARAYVALKMAVAPHLKGQVDKIHKDYLELRPMLLAWILQLEESEQLNDDNVPPRVASLVARARRDSKQLHRNKNTGQLNTPEEQYRANLMRLLWSERSASLYSIFKGKKQYEFVLNSHED